MTWAGPALRALRWLKAEILRIRTRLLLINAIAVLVPVIGITWARTFEREALRALELDMRHQAELLRTILEQNPDPHGRPRAELVAGALELAAQRTRTRVRLLDRAGRLVADSHRHGPPEGPEPAVPRMLGGSYSPERRHPGQTDPGPLHDRREIRAARRGELGTATRVHQRIQRVYLFLAMPVMVKRRVTGIVYLTRSTVPVLMALYRLRTSLVQVLLVALGFTGVLTLFFATTISRPLSRLTRGAQRIAAGDRTARLRLDRSDEIGQLARSFDALVAKLDARAHAIAEFAANISHEFKTPLTSIRGAAELLADGAGDDLAARQRFLGNILQDVRRLDRLVTRLLELSRIEATSEQREPFDLAALVREVSQEFTNADDCPLQVVGADRPLPLQGNRAHLQSALRALLENALRHSPAGSPVCLTVTPAVDELALSVSDRGDGISASNQQKIFERFFTTEAARGGSGLGLAIVATVARGHGGSVAVDSTVGRGSTFTITLPWEHPVS